MIDIEYSDEKEEDRQIRGVTLHVRLGSTDSWLSADTSLPLLDEGDADDDLDEELEPEVNSSSLTEVALATEQAADFGSLKNKGQRQDFVLTILKKKEFKEVPSYYASEIAQRADGIYEFGVLPERVRSLSGQGKSIVEISKALGLAKQKTERALSAQTPEFISEMMKSTQKSV